LNYGGIKPDLLPFVCDMAEAKQNNFLPGSHIPIFPPELIEKIKPDFVLILPWNISAEIQSQFDAVYDWGGSFVMAVPSLTIYSR